MKRTVFRAAAMMIAVCLALVFGAGAATAGDYSEIVDIHKYPEWVDESLDSDAAFQKGNESYTAGKYTHAESYYLLALKQIRTARDNQYTAGDICNNLVLTLLQLEENETAYKLCRYMLEEKLAKSTEDRCGYMLNLLVCAHANGYSAAKELQDAMDQGTFSFWSLARLAEDNQASFGTMLADMIYNIVYMDMESDLYDGAASFYYLPSDTLEKLTGDHQALIGELAGRTGGLGEPAEEGLRNEINGSASRREYLRILQDILQEVKQWQEDAGNEEDPELQALTEYLDALAEQAE